MPMVNDVLLKLQAEWGFSQAEIVAIRDAIVDVGLAAIHDSAVAKELFDSIGGEALN